MDLVVQKKKLAEAEAGQSVGEFHYPDYRFRRYEKQIVEENSKEISDL